ncbi:ATP-dependent serine protease [Burkholderia sp. Bp9090]|uniref:ATP-dependent serine protease n=1 Tax=unclassified Burkholderia TaxID=2613784 RepID=UPI000F56FA54|nr:MULTISPECIES: ATP-dependent serine protease [unclassified Burkholderia]RQR88789.1 ATP-dependent serine protease [Burkholderia sp. Bp9011]RQR97951.1 ATP-dependent serine protease [Burkholderia sp. Bp9010]RQS12681.1 ATP-dependent serine protease [Burkholderia sp. Bp8991]RQS81432.1 ATP-dependent serine protease [Burkholderia sp. Bp8977]RQZ42177.1 ATP-dependent serine protease [Burkholderia sp. Bp9090]
MQVLPIRKVRTRDTLRGALNLRAEPRDAVSQRCRQCGFMAFRATEQCPVCGLGDWPFAPLSESSESRESRESSDQSNQSDEAQAAPPHDALPVPTWSSRIGAAVRSAAIRRPSASSAPLLSILTLVLLVGGYVTFDRTCKADPVCRGQGAPAPAANDASLHAADAQTLPVVPAPVYAFHPADHPALDPDRLAAADRLDATDRAGYAGTSRHMTGRTATTVARHAPVVRARSGTRVVNWKGGATATRHAHAIRRVSLHTRHGRRATASATQVAMVYRAH